MTPLEVRARIEALLREPNAPPEVASFFLSKMQRVPCPTPSCPGRLSRTTRTCSRCGNKLDPQTASAHARAASRTSTTRAERRARGLSGAGQLAAAQASALHGAPQGSSLFAEKPYALPPPEALKAANAVLAADAKKLASKDSESEHVHE